MVRFLRYGWIGMVLLAACAGTAPNVLHVQATSQGLLSKQVEINDAALERRLAFGEVSVKPLEGGASMETQVIIRNTSMRDLKFEYRFIWYDASGFEISPNIAWIPVVLSGKDERAFKSVAPAPNAASFKCMIRKSHPLRDS
ncbi:MAG: YcfL family protein [Desulfomonilia bacterium]|nr:YcfL family protein [Desulfomonilia bacterium]